MKRPPGVFGGPLLDLWLWSVWLLLVNARGLISVQWSV